MRCLVTGAAGFIGSHLCEALLEHRCKVIGIDSFTDFYSRKIKQANLKNLINNVNFSFIQENLLSVDLFSVLTGVDYVYHMAAQAGVRTSWGKDFRIYGEYNIMATQKLLEVVKEFNVKKFVFASSSSVYGDTTDLPMREESALRPISPYGVTKLAAENLVSLYEKNFGIPTISLRYFTVYGPRQRPDMAFNKFISAILNDEKITVYGDGTQTRDFTYISDIIDAILLSVQTDVSGEIFNLGGGDMISVNDVIKLIEKNTSKKANVKYIDKQAGDAMHTMASITKAKKMLGYSPKVKIKEGIINEINWIKERLDDD
jgi:UDP-glucose 4-epimerase